MATPIRLTLATNTKKSSATRAAGSIASGNVVVEYDNEENQLDVLDALEKIKQRIIEEYLDATA